MAILAIKGHATRGSEVIELLEMLGGRDTYNNNTGSDLGFYYSIENGEIKSWKRKYLDDSYIYFTLEEFLEKYPYKVGDRVLLPFGGASTIKSMYWNESENAMRYKAQGVDNLVFGAAPLQPYTEQKEETAEETENSVVVNNELKQLKVHSLRHDKVQLIIDDKYELKQEGNAYYIVKKKPQYPKTYEECCKVLLLKPERATFSVSGLEYERFSVVNLQRLLICRDAYWKVAGNWKPDWNKTNYYINCIPCFLSDILPFPTEEMRDAFFGNFKELIESCKELL